jgi:hypothetical protein
MFHKCEGPDTYMTIPGGFCQSFTSQHASPAQSVGLMCFPPRVSGDTPAIYRRAIAKVPWTGGIFDELHAIWSGNAARKLIRLIPSAGSHPLPWIFLQRRTVIHNPLAG